MNRALDRVGPTLSFIVPDGQISARGLAATACIAIGLPYVLLKVYYVLFNPLNQFPGPLLARYSSIYRMYWDIVQGGGWTEHLHDLHARYGPIVRVAPNELHFSDPQAHSDIYPVGSKYLKDPSFYNAFLPDLSLFPQIDPHEIVWRKKLINPFFSRSSIMELEYVIQGKVDLLVSQLSFNHREEPADIHLAIKAAALDIITSYCFSESFDTLRASKFEHYILLGIDQVISTIWMIRHFRSFMVMVINLPKWLTDILGTSSKAVDAQTRHVSMLIDSVIDENDMGTDKRANILHTLYSKRNNVPAPANTKSWLIDEALMLRFAGSDTVGNTGSTAIYYLLQNPTICDKLVQELVSAWPEKESAMKWEGLEKLPYLTAVIKESLRLGHGVVSPLPRILGSEGAIIAGVPIPGKTIVAMGTTFVHLNEEIFPGPQVFNPERWLSPDAKDLDKYLVPFGRGPRSCLGINLAWCELYLIVGNLFRKLSLTQVGDKGFVENGFNDFFTIDYRGPPPLVTVTERA